MLANGLKAPHGFEIAPALCANNGPVIAEILNPKKARDVNVYCRQLSRAWQTTRLSALFGESLTGSA